MNIYDWLYLGFITIIWAGNVAQIYRVLKTRDVHAFSLWWLSAFLVSWSGRLPRAITATEYPIWATCYGISILIFLALYVLILYYKFKHRKGNSD